METVKAAKVFIEAELAKYGTWEEAKKVSVCGHLFETSASFAQAKGEQGIGIRQIHAFLGKQWSRYLIENTLSVIRQEEAAKSFIEANLGVVENGRKPKRKKRTP